MNAHPAADLFPLMDGAEYVALVMDIREHGLREPIVLHPDGSIIDGRNRFRACEDAGVPPHFTTWQDDGNPVSYVVSLNLHRRHLSESQRAMVAARIANMQEGRPRKTVQICTVSPTLPIETPYTPPLAPVSRTQAADILNTSTRSVASAAEVITKGVPELVAAVDAGEMAVSAAAQVARLPHEEQREIVVAAKPHVAHNSGDNEWYTPQAFIDGARAVMGGIDCDPASSDEANALVGATIFYTAEQDGLCHPWRGRVWMNPPYAGDLIGKFCQQLVYSFQCGEVTEACVLVNNATETRWFQLLAHEASAVLFPAGRVKFWHPRKESMPLQGQALLYLGTHTAVFQQTFAEMGVVCYFV